jgi:putative membrane protein
LQPQEIMKTGDVARGAMVGLVGGLLAAGAMSLVHRILAAPSPEAREAPSSPPEDPTVKVASRATRLVGYRLAEHQKAPAGSLVHYGFGAVVGALYGAAAEIIPRIRMAFGLPFGAAVWLGAHVIAVPALGLAESPARQPVGKEAEELGLHFVYGSVTELVRRLLRR